VVNLAIPPAAFARKYAPQPAFATKHVEQTDTETDEKQRTENNLARAEISET